MRNYRTAKQKIKSQANNERYNQVSMFLYLFHPPVLYVSICMAARHTHFLHAVVLWLSNNVLDHLDGTVSTIYNLEASSQCMRTFWCEMFVSSSQGAPA